MLLYSGFLNVPGPFKLNPYDSLSIHYQFHVPGFALHLPQPVSALSTSFERPLENGVRILPGVADSPC